MSLINDPLKERREAIAMRCERQLSSTALTSTLAPARVKKLPVVTLSNLPPDMTEQRLTDLVMALHSDGRPPTLTLECQAQTASVHLHSVEAAENVAEFFDGVVVDEHDITASLRLKLIDGEEADDAAKPNKSDGADGEKRKKKKAIKTISMAGFNGHYGKDGKGKTLKLIKK